MPALTTAIGTICSATPDPWAVVIQGQVYEAADPQSWEPTVGQVVLVDYLPVSGQFVIVAIV